MDPIIAEAPLSVKTPLSNYRAYPIRGHSCWDGLVAHLGRAHAVVAQDSGEEEAKLFITYVAYGARLHYQPGQSDGHISQRATTWREPSVWCIAYEIVYLQHAGGQFFSAKMG